MVDTYRIYAREEKSDLIQAQAAGDTADAESATEATEGCF